MPDLEVHNLENEGSSTILKLSLLGTKLKTSALLTRVRQPAQDFSLNSKISYYILKSNGLRLFCWAGFFIACFARRASEAKYAMEVGLET